MAGFRSAQTFGYQGKQEFTDDLRILKPDSGFTHVLSYTKTGANTVIRILPSFNEYGEEESPISPEGDPDNRDVSLGMAFCSLPVVRIFKGGNHWFVGDVQRKNANGEDIMLTDKDGKLRKVGMAPHNLFASRMSYKIWFENYRAQKGLTPDCPKNWLQWNINKADTMYFVQCMAREINGVSEKDAQGLIKINPRCVFGIPPSAAAVFFSEILTREDDTQPLSVSNNRVGDFCSCDGGRWMRLSKVVTKKDPNSTTEKGKTDYKLGLTPTVIKIKPDEAKKIVQPWVDIIHIPTIEEIMDFLLDSFDGTVLDYVFRDTEYYSFIPKQFHGYSKDIASAKKKVDVELELAEKAKVSGDTTGEDTGCAPISVVSAPVVSQPPVTKPAPKAAFRPAAGPVSSGVSFTAPAEEPVGGSVDDDDIPFDVDAVAQAAAAVAAKSAANKAQPAPGADPDKYKKALQRLSPKVNLA